MIKLNSKSNKLLINNLYSFKIDMFIKDNGKIIKEMEEVYKFGKMVLFIKVIGKII
jgi:hypothetical protein